MESSSQEIHENLNAVIDYQTHHRLRETQGRHRAEELNERIMIWSVFVTLAIFGVGFGQVFVLKSFFAEKKPSAMYGRHWLILPRPYAPPTLSGVTIMITRMKQWSKAVIMDFSVSVTGTTHYLLIILWLFIQNSYKTVQSKSLVPPARRNCVVLQVLNQIFLWISWFWAFSLVEIQSGFLESLHGTGCFTCNFIYPRP